MEELRSIKASHLEGFVANYSSSQDLSPCSRPVVENQRWNYQETYFQNQNKDSDAVLRKLRGVLNKITPEKFDRLCQEIIKIGINSVSLLKGLAYLIYEKAIDEHRYSSLYANLCRRLYYEAPNFDVATSDDPNLPKPNTFRRLLIVKLQKEFENRDKNLDIYNGKEDLTSDEEEEKSKAKHHVLGNIKFIGELYRLDLLPESILHKCIKQLIKSKTRNDSDLSKDLECLCQILTTCGRKLDHEKAKYLMNQYFKRMQYLYDKKSFLPPRIRFMLQDVIELRSANWTPRRPQSSQGPKTLGQIRSEVGLENPGLLFDPHFMRVPNTSLDRGYYSNINDINSYKSGSSYKSDSTFFNSTSYSNSKQTFDFFGSQTKVENNVKDTQKRTENKIPLKTTLVKTNERIQNGDERDCVSSASSSSSASSFSNHDSRQPIKPIRKNSSSNNFCKSSTFDPFPDWNKNGHRRNSSSGNNSFHTDRHFTGSGPDPLENHNYTKLGINSNPPKRVSVLPSNSCVDAFQPTFQHVIDSAQHNVIRKKNFQNLAEKQDRNKQKLVTTQLVSAPQEINQVIEQIARQLLVANSKTKEYQYHFDRLSKLSNDSICQCWSKMLQKSLIESDEKKIKACQVLQQACDKHLVQSEAIKEIVVKIVETYKSGPQSMDFLPLAKLLSSLIDYNFLNLQDLKDVVGVDNSLHIFLLTIKQLANSNQPKVTEDFKKSRIELLKMLPDGSDTSEYLLKELEQLQLCFLHPFLSMEVELSAQIRQNSNYSHLYPWLCENKSFKDLKDPQFIQILIKCFLNNIFHSNLCLKQDGKTSEEEKNSLLNLSSLLQKFLHDDPDLQLAALYATQTFCYQKDFPKGLIRQLFNYFYNEDVIDEEVFFRWKDDVNDDYEGKQKALFQVNSWLVWLQEADTEDDS